MFYLLEHLLNHRGDVVLLGVLNERVAAVLEIETKE